MSGWIGVDFDSTLAYYDGSFSGELGHPIPAMLARVKKWLAEGREVRIFTARVSGGTNRDTEYFRTLIEDWCVRHVGQKLPVTCCKDYAMVELWDDRAVQIIPNTGMRVDGKE